MIKKKDDENLITGASGFIGGFLVKEALDRGHEVWAGIRSGSDCSNLQDKRIRFIDLHYENPSSLAKQLKEVKDKCGAFEYVVHNAD
jgi:nucleoside-diphosphate-sugar epimerase